MSEADTSMRRSGYNARIFAGGPRRWFHLARFHWATRASARADLSRVVELGCFDGRLLDHLPRQPDFYVGADAGWEGGLASAQQRFAGRSDRRFIKTSAPGAFDEHKDGDFTSAFALETLEHVPPELVDGYLAELARLVRGDIFITVPNEKGFVFLVKWLIKKAFFGDGERYTAREVLAASIGRLDLVERREHKGFDYHALAAQVARHFDDVRLHGVSPPLLPPFLSFTVAISARAKAR